jgi:predicted nucleotidyltransferase
MSNQISKITQEFKCAVKKKYEVIEMKLFGSAARGDSNQSSDVDIMVKLPMVDRKIEEDLFNMAYDLELEYDCVIDVIVLSQNTANYPPLYQNIEREGILI